MMRLVLTACACVLMFQVTPIAAQMSQYNKVKQSGRQFQGWKNDRSAPLIQQCEIQAYNLETRFQNHNASVAQSVQGVEDQIRVLHESIELVIKKLEALQDDFVEPDDYVAPSSAFSALMSSSGSSPYASSSVTLKYGTVNLNEGSDYSSSTGYYTAPVNGMYWFFLNFVAPMNSDAQAHLKVKRAAGGTDSICYVWSKYDYDSACITTVHLLAGDQVGVFPIAPLYVTWSITTGEQNSFKGYLVAEDDVDAGSTTTAAASAAADTTTTTTAGT